MLKDAQQGCQCMLLYASLRGQGKRNVVRHLARAQGLFLRTVDMLELLNPTSITPSIKKFFEAVQSAVTADDGSSLAALVEVRGFEKLEEMLSAEKDDKD